MGMRRITAINEYYEICGWIGGVFFAICGIPQAWYCYKEKHAIGLSWLFILCWLIGEVFTLGYVIASDIVSSDFHYPLIFNYVLNTLVLMVIIHYKVLGDNG